MLKFYGVLPIAICTCALSCSPVLQTSGAIKNKKLQMKKNLILTKERHIDATAEKVWAVLTDNQHIVQWLGVEMITNWQVDSEIAFTFVYKDKEVTDKGTLLHFEPNQKLSYNYWSVFSATEDVPENYSDITFTLIPQNNGVTLQLTQSNFASQMLYAHAEKNWNETLDTIKKLAEGETSWLLMNRP
jgi:uncharacterized protein YndB with AHSA1/START domain